MRLKTLKILPTEHEIQKEFFDLVNLRAQQDVVFRTVFSIPNQRGNDFYWLKMRKEEGLKKGAFDVFVAAARKGFHGLFMEFKSSTGTLSKEQLEFQKLVTLEGFLTNVFRDAVDGFKFLEAYLKGD